MVILRQTTPLRGEASKRLEIAILAFGWRPEIL
jgi:hypothetical protein